MERHDFKESTKDHDDRNGINLLRSHPEYLDCLPKPFRPASDWRKGANLRKAVLSTADIG